MNLRTLIARFKRKTTKSILKIIDSIFDTDWYWNYSFKMSAFHTSEYTFKKDQIAFVHVPKTGGTSVAKMLQQSGISRFVNLNIHKPISEFCSPAEYKYFTIIRNPIDRVWSQYQMVLREGNGYPYNKYAVRGLKCFLENCWAVRNMACSYYSGQVHQESTLETYEKAVENLQQFYKVLSFENFNFEIKDFFKEENIQYQDILHERKSTYDGPNQQEKDQIIAYNKFDIMLFEKWENQNRKKDE